MFNSFDVVNRDMPVNTTPQSTQVGNTEKYEGKDNPGGGMYYRREARKEKPKVKERPKGDHRVDLVA